MSKKEFRCPICNKKFFVTVGDVTGVVEIKCDRCKTLQSVTLTSKDASGTIEVIRVS